MKKLHWRLMGSPADPYTLVMAKSVTGTYFVMPTEMWVSNDRKGIGYLPMYRPVDEPSPRKIFRLVDASADIPRTLEQAKALAQRHRDYGGTRIDETSLVEVL